MVSKLLTALPDPAKRTIRRIVPISVRRSVHSRVFSQSWFRQDQYITFTTNGFVSASSPATLLARHNYEVMYLRRALTGVSVERSLEIGCGFGRLSPIVAEFSRHPTGIDINDRALDLARRCYPALTFERASVTNLSWPDDHFGLVVTWTVLQHIRPEFIDQAISEIRRVLTDDGVLILCETTTPVSDEDLAVKHTWERGRDFYAERLSPFRLHWSTSMNEIDRLDDVDAPGELMVFK
jgi:SAM-dependent methyltransferase